jgi:hypothetical protein
MLFPGGIYIAGAFFAVIGICFITALSGLMALIGFKISDVLIGKTKLDHYRKTGAKDCWRWWMNKEMWAWISFGISWLLLAYTIAGPYVALLKYLSGA